MNEAPRKKKETEEPGRRSNRHQAPQPGSRPSEAPGAQWRQRRKWVVGRRVVAPEAGPSAYEAYSFARAV